MSVRESVQRKGRADVFIIRKYDFLKQKTLSSNKKRIPWKQEEDELLISLVKKTSEPNWIEISRQLEIRTCLQCEERWNKVLKPGLKKGKWSKEEDDILINFVKKFGPQNWAMLCSVLKGRSPKQIRDRWINNLNPKRIKFKWTDELDEVLLCNYIKHGSKWTLISKLIYGTTENVVKNRFYSLLRSTAVRHSSKTNSNSEPLSKKINEADLKNNSFEEIDKFFNFFESDEINKSTVNEKSFIKEEKYTVKQRKKFSLDELIKFLPYLLEERNIDISGEKIKEGGLGQTKLETNQMYSSNLAEQQQNQTCETGYKPNSQINDTSFANKIMSFTNILEKIESKNKQNTFKIKSSIILNLQLSLLNRIFLRLKTQMIHKFFESFKGNTLDS